MTVSSKTTTVCPGKKISRRLHPTPNAVCFSTCFLPLGSHVRNVRPCDPTLLLAGLDIAKEGKNVLISAEDFSNIDDKGIQSLSTYLSNWYKTTIIVYYRRYYYNWLRSLYNQQTKNRKLKEAHLWESTWIKSLM